jgi:hypothetical protein
MLAGACYEGTDLHLLPPCGFSRSVIRNDEKLAANYYRYINPAGLDFGRRSGIRQAAAHAAGWRVRKLTMTQCVPVFTTVARSRHFAAFSEDWRVECTALALMRKTTALIAIPALGIVCMAGLVYRAWRANSNALAIAAAATHKAALADSAEITRGIKNYWDAKNGREELENDVMRLKNDLLRYEIARLEGKSRNRSQIDQDRTVIVNDKLALGLIDPSAPMFDPYAAEARIAEHNRKYPRDPIANISDINREMERFHSEVNAIIQNGNEELRTLRNGGSR